MRSMLMPLILVTALFAGCATVVNPVTGREVEYTHDMQQPQPRFILLCQ